MEIRVTEMNASDEVTIRTRFHDYSFRVTDPRCCRGLLSGGLLGNQPHEALFVGEILTDEMSFDSSLLEPGHHAVFLFSENGIGRLTTSIITELKLMEQLKPDS